MENRAGGMENQVPKEVFVRIGPHHVPRIRSFITEVEFWVVFGPFGLAGLNGRAVHSGVIWYILVHFDVKNLTKIRTKYFVRWR